MARKLILHIGTPKTGSTSVQHTLFAHRDQLAAAGVHWGDSTREPRAAAPRHSSVSHALRRGPRKWDAERDAILADFDASGHDTLLLSDEVLSECGAKAIARMAEFAAPFETTVICYLRRQDRYVESLWNQYCGEGRREPRSIRKFATAREVRKRLDYGAMLDAWRGVGTVKAVSFDAARSALVPGFLGALGLDMTLTDEVRKNVSPSMNCAALLAQLNRQGVTYNRAKVIKAFRHDTLKTALGRTLRRALLAELQDANTELAARYGVTFDDTMPDEPDRPLYAPTEAALAHAISRLAPGRKAGAKAKDATDPTG
ncbi:hypothetical protein [Celeribacter sp.]|uniref:hypothetical protein n=1 Tax=Celeribacter sp. TaxID=1890673 RepID=UPI003A93B259